MNRETTKKEKTVTIYFTARNGKVQSFGGDMARKEAQAYVNRNNAAASRRGDESKPYTLLAYTIPAEEG